MAKTRKAGKRGGVKLSPRVKATRSKERNLKKLENLVKKKTKKMETAEKKVMKAQEKLDKELQNIEAINLELQKAMTDYDIAFSTKTFNTLSGAQMGGNMY